MGHRDALRDAMVQEAPLLHHRDLRPKASRQLVKSALGASGGVHPGASVGAFREQHPSQVEDAGRSVSRVPDGPARDGPAPGADCSLRRAALCRLDEGRFAA